MTTAGRSRPRLGAGDRPQGADPSPARLRGRWVALGLLAVAGAGLVGIVAGPAGIAPVDVARTLLHLPSGATAQQVVIIEQIRLPRVVLGLLVGATLSVSGASYQGVFRNPLADPWLLGAAAGAGLAVTFIIVSTADGAALPITAPLAAFGGAIAAVALTYALSTATGGRASTSSLILAGVAVAAFLTAGQTYLQQRNQDTIRQVYTWILGRLSGGGWGDVGVLLPYALASWVVLLASARRLDVLAVGDEEAAALGIDVRRTQLVVVVAATLGTAAAVAASGLIGFVGIIVPHLVRTVAGTANRVVLPLSLLFGAAFLCLADVVARLAASPAELPIGVVTAFVGAPFFLVVMRSTRSGGFGR